MQEVLITGGSGFFGGVLKRRLLAEGFRCVNIDLVPDPDRHENLESIQGDLRDQSLLSQTFASHKFAAVFHCAAMLAHGAMDEQLLWSSNVGRHPQRRRRLPPFRSTNPGLHLRLTAYGAATSATRWRKTRKPQPIEIYGRSKLAAEEALAEYRDALNVIILRCPTIIDSGRLGPASDPL